MVYYTSDYRYSGFCPLCNILWEHSVSETVCFHFDESSVDPHLWAMQINQLDLYKHVRSGYVSRI
jgi:hypothetical protein